MSLAISMTVEPDSGFVASCLLGTDGYLYISYGNKDSGYSYLVLKDPADKQKLLDVLTYPYAPRPAPESALDDARLAAIISGR